MRQCRARARHAAVGQRRRAQHRRTGRVRGRLDARHVAHARRLGRSGRARGARPGRLPARRRGRGDTAARPGRGARVRVRDRLRGADARGRIRVPHAAVRLDDATTSRRSISSPPTAGWSAHRNGRTAICSGDCVAAAATSASPRASSYRLHPVGPDIIAGAIAWRGEEAASVLEMYRSLATPAPRELTCVAGLRLAPPAPWIAKDVHWQANRCPLCVLFRTARGR